MGFGDQSIPYPAANDYGSRRRWPTLAIVWHVAEGRNVAQYLSRDPARGVSVHYTIEQATDRWHDGEVVRCLPEDRISGSINPKTVRRSDDPGGYYGASHAKAGIGRYWPDTSPNVLVISVEVAGIAKEGPTEAQQRSMVALWDELKGRYPRSIPLGHRDWQDVKPCPGKTASMKAAFSAMGGHGTDHSEVRHMSTRDYASGQVCTVRDGSKLYDYPGGLAIGTVDPPLVRDYLGRDETGDYGLISSELDGKSRTAWVSTKAVSKVRPAPTPSPDCADAIEAERERVKAAALAAIKGI
jgi:N-acetyl-anhydromuramyl-L-alanine amidase AmpD